VVLEKEFQLKQTETNERLATYEQMGIAAMIPGMQHMLEMMTAELANMRARLGMLQEPAAPRKKLGRPKKGAPARVSAGKSGWSDDPAERSREMKRRMAVAAKKKGIDAKGLHPRDVGHPEHDKWLKATRRAHKAHWNALSFKERKERLERMKAGRKLPPKKKSHHKQVPQVALAEAS